MTDDQLREALDEVSQYYRRFPGSAKMIPADSLIFDAARKWLESPSEAAIEAMGQVSIEVYDGDGYRSGLVKDHLSPDERRALAEAYRTAEIGEGT